VVGGAWVGAEVLVHFIRYYRAGDRAVGIVAAELTLVGRTQRICDGGYRDSSGESGDSKAEQVRAGQSKSEQVRASLATVYTGYTCSSLTSSSIHYLHWLHLQPTH
jgi:hypothetical protein